MALKYTDVMLDIETTGLQPDRNAILQIGAVRFNAETQEVDPDFFDQAMSMPNYRHWDQGTLSWWGKQPPEVYSGIVARSRPAYDVMQELQQWALPAGSLRFWSKPTHFDFMFISSYFADLDLVNPFSYRDANDMNSYIRGLYGNKPVPPEIEKSVSVDGAAHNALNDCFYQLKVLFAHQDNVK